MLIKCLVFSLMFAGLGVNAASQRPFSPSRNTPSPNLAGDTLTLGNQPVPLFLKSIEERTGTSLKQNATDSVLKDCPMPVQRPDTSQLERMRVAKPSADISYSMPRPALKCHNPLDRGK